MLFALYYKEGPWNYQIFFALMSLALILGKRDEVTLFVMKSTAKTIRNFSGVRLARPDFPNDVTRCSLDCILLKTQLKK
ncbi:hypothetical protein CH333_07990 [candidate division WOR-3 bacterium JGI_Cruoil_03_44_89]|uniref:Uncharacterized protein n=1 Tax=candidate division WOR-3 bacterium JGI_Cruoil_03_44_89 TaxID=1973748 RepID=A0A235BQ12_UNCW3|nr:MAG: hypothetical protein CH333_07990 [candidate division WOR-3 bacterium JGI_Cruoil_03_44_89]